jgi:phenylpyruvate tautomerase PptA (4-oxalocrotonate tautomerase family)
MAQVEVFAQRDHIEAVRAQLSDAIHRVLRDTLGLPPDKRFHRFIALDEADLVHPPDRSARYTIVEIVMFEGRSEATRRACLRRLMQDIPDAVGMSVHDLEIVILESPRCNWGIRGKVGDELRVPYQVEV